MCSRWLGAIIFILCSSTAIGQTRFYLSSTEAAPISPAFNTGMSFGIWNVTTGADRLKMSTTKDGSTMTSKTSGAVGAAATRLVLIRQYVSAPLAAQTITASSASDFLRMQIRSAMSSTSSSTGQLAVNLYVVTPAGAIRGILLDWAGTGTNLPQTTLTNRGTASSTTGLKYTDWATTGNISVQDGDYLVFETGWAYTSGTNTTRTATQSFGSNNATDLPNDNSTTTANNPWIELSQTLTFYTPPAPSNSGNGLLLFY